VKQLILHGHVLINWKITRIPNFLVKKYDYISLSRTSIFFIKESLCNNLFKTPLYFSFLRRKKKIQKRAKMNQLFIYFKFSLFLEVNFRIFTIFVFMEPKVQETFFNNISSLYDYNQLKFII
jgi:hypothetical protein